MSAGSEIASEQLQGRITWKATDKLALLVSGGGDIRQFLNGNLPATATPIFSASVVYQPFQATTLSLAANQTISPAYFANQMTTGTGLSASLHQRLLGKLFLDITGTYQITSYAATTSTVTTSREDHITSVSVRLSAPFRKRGTTAVFYQATENSSNEAGYTLSSTQVGLEISYHF